LIKMTTGQRCRGLPQRALLDPPVLHDRDPVTHGHRSTWSWVT
jgi:hypothetical protein